MAGRLFSMRSVPQDSAQSPIGFDSLLPLLTNKQSGDGMSFSLFKENFASGFSSIRRRLSSSDIPGEMQDERPHPQPQHPQAQPVASSGSHQTLTQKQPQQPHARPTALPTQAAPPPQSKMMSAPTSPQQTAVPQFARGLFSAANKYVSAAVSSATHTKEGGYKGKVILVIDDGGVTDWSRFFRGKKIGESELRIEQAEFREIHLVSMPRGDVVVEIHSERGGATVQRYFKPDLVLVRQHVLNDQPGRLANDDNRRIIVGLDTAGLPAVNSLASVYNFADRGWVYSNLLKIQRRFGAERFPLIEKSFYANYQELIECPPTYKGSVVIKTGNGHVGLGKMKLDASLDIREIAHLLMGSTTGGQSYLTVEPFIERATDIYLIKIGTAYRAYARKSLQGHWKATIGPHSMEALQVNDRYKFWVDQCSELFGGLDIVAVAIIQARDGREFIVEVKDSTANLSVEGIHDQERQLVADLCVSKLSYFSRDTSVSMEPLCVSSAEPVVIRHRTSSSQQASPAPQSVQGASSPAIQRQTSTGPSAGPTPPSTQSVPQPQPTRPSPQPLQTLAQQQQHQQQQKQQPPQPQPQPQKQQQQQPQRQVQSPQQSQPQQRSGPPQTQPSPPPPPPPPPPPQQPAHPPQQPPPPQQPAHPPQQPAHPPQQPPPPQQPAHPPQQPPPPQPKPTSSQAQSPPPPPPPVASQNPFLIDMAPNVPSPADQPAHPPPLIPVSVQQSAPAVPSAPPPPPTSVPSTTSSGPPAHPPGPPAHPPPPRQHSSAGPQPHKGPPPPPPPAGRQASVGGQSAPQQPPGHPARPPPAGGPPPPPPPPSGHSPTPQQGQPTVGGRLGQAFSNKSQSLMEDTEDTMKNLKKTFAGIFGEM